MISFLKTLIIRAGEKCLAAQQTLTPEDVEFKNRKDLVTQADKQVEDFLVREIRTRFPDHGILGEETGRTGNGRDYLWIIDPIDGTTSFFHGQPFYSVSIALARKNEIILGAVNAPVLNQLFLAERGSGALLNGAPIRVSDTTSLVDSVMATGFACLRAGAEPNNLVHFNRIVPRLRDIRRFGSAAIDLSYVACGKLDGFWEMNLNIYDIAAGSLIVEEAGGRVADFNGMAAYPENGIVAANDALCNRLIDQLSVHP